MKSTRKAHAGTDDVIYPLQICYPVGDEKNSEDVEVINIGIQDEISGFEMGSATLYATAYNKWEVLMSGENVVYMGEEFWDSVDMKKSTFVCTF